MRDEHDYGHYIESLDTLLPGIALSCVLPSYLRPLHASMGMLIPTVRNSIKGFDEIRAAGRYWTKDRLEKVEAKIVDRTDLLDKFFKIRQEKEGWDVPDIASEACVAIFAGSDTTAIAIRSILYHLMRRRACYEKLVAEIDQADAAGKVSSPHIKYSEALKLPYLVACCKEGMRLHPSVGLGMPRHVPAGGKVIAGRFFPEGSRVSINAAVVHYDENVFGKDAADFNPDRWLIGDAANMDKHMLHFGGGSRTCIGKNVRQTALGSHNCNHDLFTGNWHRPLTFCAADFTCRNAQANSSISEKIPHRVGGSCEGVAHRKLLVQQADWHSCSSDC